MYNWKITNIKCVLDQDGKQNIVKEVEFSIDDLINGGVVIPYTEGDFLAYDQLTEDVVIGWVKSVLTEALVSSYEAKVDQLKNPATTGYKPLPWEA